MTDLYSEAFGSRLQNLAATHCREYPTTLPFPHLVLDGFLPTDIAQRLLDGFPRVDQMKWQKFDDPRQKKLAFARVSELDPVIRECIAFLNSAVVLQFLEQLTGISGLIPDPYLTGGGLHQIETGGKLDIHADFNRLDSLRLDRRLNLLLYLNKDWKEEYGGHLELWDAEMKKRVRAVLPVFNRCVVFSTTDTAHHGHPVPLACPRGWTRKSIALYYYTNGRPAHERSKSHTTVFKVLPNGHNRAIEWTKLIGRALMPPILLDAYRLTRGR